MSFDQFRRFLADQRSSMVSTILEEDEDAASDATSQVTLEDRLKAMYEQVDDEDLAKYLRERWNAFVSFKRYVLGSTHRVPCMLRSTHMVQCTLGLVYTKLLHQYCDSSPGTLAIVFSFKTMGSLENGVANHFQAT